MVLEILQTTKRDKQEVSMYGSFGIEYGSEGSTFGVVL